MVIYIMLKKGSPLYFLLGVGRAKERERSFTNAYGWRGTDALL